MDTDTRIAAAGAARACDGLKLPGIGLAPPVAIGASGRHADFPGALSIGTAALSALLWN
jgi:creatinine amidohydrolase